MTSQQLVARKIAYLAAMAVLLFPLLLVGRPATRDSEGGELAKLRREHRLGQSQFGAISASSEAARLGSLGLHGVGVAVLWQQAFEYKKTENWAAYESTLNQIAAILPNYINVWEFQAWNLSYNLSVAFDDYRQRYEWVKKGIDFLKKGYEQNRESPRLAWNIGWFTTQKIGRADEQQQFRKLYREEFEEDNWQVGKRWYLEAQRLVDAGVPFRGMNTALFHSQPGLAQMYYAKALQNDGLELDERDALSPVERASHIARYVQRWRGAWLTAQDDWFKATGRSLGDRGLPVGQGIMVRFNEEDDLRTQRKAGLAKIYNEWPGAVEDTLAAHREKLEKDQPDILDVLNKPRAKRSSTQSVSMTLVLAEQSWLHEMVERVPAEQQVAARALADEALLAHAKIGILEKFNDITQFDYWKNRALVEASDAALSARANFDEAKRARRKGRLTAARRYYEAGFENWSTLVKAHPNLEKDVATGGEVADLIVEYRRLVVEDLDGKFPQPFVLQSLLIEQIKDQPEADLFPGMPKTPDPQPDPAKPTPGIPTVPPPPGTTK